MSVRDELLEDDAISLTSSDPAASALRGSPSKNRRCGTLFSCRGPGCCWMITALGFGRQSLQPDQAALQEYFLTLGFLYITAVPGHVGPLVQMFVPHRDLCINESLLLWQGQLRFRQYIPSKRKRFGIKLFMLCDGLTGYVLNVIVYTGSSTDITHAPGLGVSGKVVLTLYVNNWYTSPFLFHHLLRAKTGACGMVRANRKGMPCFRDKMSSGEADSSCEEMLAVKWHDKRDVHMLTTVHSAEMSPSAKKDHTTGYEKIKPQCVLDYNKKMGAVDKHDKPKVPAKSCSPTCGRTPQPPEAICWWTLSCLQPTCLTASISPLRSLQPSNREEHMQALQGLPVHQKGPTEKAEDKVHVQTLQHSTVSSRGALNSTTLGLF
ncbi:hypothetical protein QQF64_036118 [Cirrhinus molitorella]|uniref:PiggyBac transposable element-derived protein domain-containing protein n=1 Tax=Cirrhinus molitorella TaxID=172907 RepID=A0ABR3NHM1_9TELE